MSVHLNRPRRCFSKGTLPVIRELFSFDDGYRDNYLNAFPILKQLEIPATIFLAAGVVGCKRVIWHECRKTFTIHEAQVLTRMKLANIGIGLLINFNVKRLVDGIRSFRL
jgi:hypothetical protein